MAEKAPVEELSIDGYDAPVKPWTEARAALDEEKGKVRRVWLATTRHGGAPHVMPVGAIWLEDAIYFNAGAGTRKAKNLDANPKCVVGFAVPGLDLVFEGDALRVTDEDTVEHLAEVFRSNGWPVEARDGQFYAPYSAPSAGPPPWNLYQVTVSTVFGIEVEEPHSAMRWRF